jgi:hypothetical protein
VVIARQVRYRDGKRWHVGGRRRDGGAGKFQVWDLAAAEDIFQMRRESYLAGMSRRQMQQSDINPAGLPGL